MSPRLSIILGYRDRDLERVQRCLGSLASQAASDFEVVFVDYGSQPAAAAAARRLCEGFGFVRYVHSETRGHPWNRARALNVGARTAEGEYILTSDVDMIFGPGFVDTTKERLDPGRVLHCRTWFLPRDFSDWHDLEGATAGLRRAGHSAYGGCQAVAAETFRRLGGFDETYEYWGIEDRDFHQRLVLVGLDAEWMEDAVLFHQWHPAADVKTPGFLPAGLWGRMETHLHENRGEPVRNGEHWGLRLTAADRPALARLDGEGGLRRGGGLVPFRRNPYDPRSVGYLVRRLWALEPGDALVVEGADRPRRRRWLDLGLGAMNRLLRATGSGTEVGYRYNALHTFVAELTHRRPAVLADYYLGVPGTGVSLLVRSSRHTGEAGVPEMRT